MKLKTKIKYKGFGPFLMQKRGNPYKCYYCGKDEVCTKDHFFPRSMSNERDKKLIEILYPGVPNILIYSCRKCQRTKGSYLPHEFIQRIEGKRLYTEVEVIRIKNAIKSLVKLLKEDHG